MGNNLTDDPNHLFTLRIPIRNESVVVYAYHDVKHSIGSTHTYIDILVRMNGEEVFKRGKLYVGIPAGHTIDGIYAKEAVLSCVAMKPGDTDLEYFQNYTNPQLAFASTFGEELSAIREMRYCDPETGEVRSPKRR